MNVNQHPASFHANEEVMAELAEREGWKEAGSKNFCVGLIIFAVLMLAGVLLASVSKSLFGVSALIFLGLSFMAASIISAVYLYLTNLAVDKKRRSLLRLEVHLNNLQIVERCTAVPMEDFRNILRFGEKVVSPNLVAYLSGCMDLIGSFHGEESKKWYKNYAELYRAAYQLKLLPSDAPAEPLTYEQVDDSVLTK